MRLPHTVTVLRAPLVTDAKGNKVRDWTTATQTPAAAWVQPLTSDEQTLGQDRVTSRWRIFLDPETVALATDRIVWQGDTYQVDGEIQAWVTQVGVHHYEGYLLRVSG